MENPRKIIGITGGIGSGKSSVAAEFARLGCAVIDADAIVSRLLEDENVILRLKNALGEEIIGGGGKIDRCIMAGTVFKSKENVEKTNSIIHPLVFEQTEKLIYKYNHCEDVKAIVLDMPLLVEVGWDKKCDKVVFVESSEVNRASRTDEKSLKTKKNLKNRQKFQISLDKKAQIAHYTINNNSDLKDLADQVVRIFSIIINN
ncbi:MAG: dephospho-CoA kinase [Planctomycetes bacterium]|nr:dephospho-CoA kinase [Planctomycetota bacterium]